MRLLAIAVLVLASSVLAAQGNPSETGPGAAAVTRRDLADAYLLVDRIVAARGAPAAHRARWNEAFDRTTLAFFGGDFAKVLRDMHALAAEMLDEGAAGSATRRLLPLRLRTAPRVVTPADSVLRVVLTVMYAEGDEPARALRLRVAGQDGRVYAEARVEVPARAAAGDRIELALPRAQLPAGNARLEVSAALDGATTELRAPLFLLDLRADSLRAMFERDLAQLPADADAQALASLRARIALLADQPDETNSAQFLADPVALAAALQEELAALQAGRDPYRRTGDTWRVLQMPTGQVPFRLYVPPQARAAQALPLVIALHGAGADENMFLEGYGHGRLRTLADSLGFLVASPMTVDFARDPATLDTLLAVVARANRFDLRRVYALGHSLGAGVTLRLAFQRRGSIRAAVLLAGAGTVPATQTVVPTLFVAAERDLVIPAARVRASYDQLLARGAPVEFALAESWGHTLVVGPELLRAVEFLLRH